MTGEEKDIVSDGQIYKPARAEDSAPHPSPTALKPCPFCGEGAAIVEAIATHREGQFMVMCGLAVCAAHGPWMKGAQEAIAAWNRRSSPTGDEGRYNPEVVARLLRAKGGPFVVAPEGADAFMAWLTEEPSAVASRGDEVRRVARAMRQFADDGHSAYVLAEVAVAAMPARAEVKRMHKLEDALSKCSNQFAFYAQQHRDKGTPDGDAKAVTNDNFVSLCDGALK